MKYEAKMWHKVGLVWVDLQETSLLDWENIFFF